MTTLHDEVERAIEAAIGAVNREHERGSIPVDARGDPDFLREMVLLEISNDDIDDWEDWDEVMGLVGRVTQRKLP